jgi:hypothetical protein
MKPETGDGGGLVPRDTAERVLRLAIEMEARRGEILTEDELFRIAHDVGVHPEYVRRALDRACRRAPAARAAARASRRVVVGLVGVGFLLMFVIGTLLAIQATGETLADGFSLEDAFELVVLVFVLGIAGGLAWFFLAAARGR